MRKTAWVGLLAVWLAAGCVESDSLQCKNGLYCPIGYACDEARGACVRPDQVEACNGHVDGDVCEIDMPADGICSGGVCLAKRCGDGVVSDLEQCDGDAFADEKYRSCKQGFGFHEDGVVTCTPQCTYNIDACSKICGDGMLDTGETCDGTALGQFSDCQQLGYYDPGALTCSGACTYDTTNCHRRCGDGTKDPEELCDGAPPALGCTDFGFDAGFAPCAPICAPDFQDCRLFGWKRFPLPPNSYIESAMIVGDTLYAGLLEGSLMTYKAGGTPNITFVADTNQSTMNELWVFSPSDIWAVTDDNQGGILHFNGTVWTNDTSYTGNNHAFWGFAPNDLYLFQDNKVRHWDGNDWTDVFTTFVPGYAYDAVATASNNIYVCSNTTLNHYTGTWGTTTIPGMSRYVKAGALGSTIFIGGSNASAHLAVARSSNGGGSWTVDDLSLLLPSSGAGQTITSIHVNAANDVWVAANTAIYHFDGAAWTIQVVPTRIDAIAALGNEVIAGGFDLFAQFGQNYRYLGTSLIDLAQITPADYELAPYSPLSAGFAVASNDIWIGASYSAPASGVPTTTFHFDGTSWLEHSMSGAGAGGDVMGIAAFGANDVYAAVGDYGVYHYSGTSTPGNEWVKDTNLVQQAYGIWGTDSTHLWAVDNFTIWRRGTGGWTAEVTNAQGDGLQAISGRSSTDVWAVGQGITYHFNGANWSIVDQSTFGGNAVWTAPGADVFVALNGGVRRYNGSVWTYFFTGIRMKGVWGTSNNDVFAVGEDSTVIHFDGSNWAPVRVDTATTLNAVFGVGQTTLIVGGSPGSSGVVRQLNRTQPW
ncbi:MAG TPA: hypothetical protein VL326_23320 [Kofleriaceae bacterium]|nr:hypothetical protein [Kofleriaceae bacterium]